MMSGERTQEQSSKRQFDALLIDANMALASLVSEETPESEEVDSKNLRRPAKHTNPSRTVSPPSPFLLANRSPSTRN